MMINDMKKNELNEREVAQVIGGCGDLLYSDAKRAFEQLNRQEEARKKAEAARQRAVQNAAARQEALRQAEAENQPGIKIHGGGVSGGW